MARWVRSSCQTSISALTSREWTLLYAGDSGFSRPWFFKTRDANAHVFSRLDFSRQGRFVCIDAVLIFPPFLFVFSVAPFAPVSVQFQFNLLVHGLTILFCVIFSWSDFYMNLLGRFRCTEKRSDFVSVSLNLLLSWCFGSFGELARIGVYPTPWTLLFYFWRPANMNLERRL